MGTPERRRAPEMSFAPPQVLLEVHQTRNCHPGGRRNGTRSKSSLWRVTITSMGRRCLLCGACDCYCPTALIWQADNIHSSHYRLCCQNYCMQQTYPFTLKDTPFFKRKFSYKRRDLQRNNSDTDQLLNW
ncbi:hypothetical protein BT69DRAFT_686845 [Atractiella rhizophila]|nr:hypothetical protein BT69DRAFT_686845 [Atractiella rhizophila]